MTQRPGEFALIADYFAPLAGQGAFGLKDDAAVFTVSPGCKAVITQDACAEAIHFLSDDPADLVAKKALRVNLSDLAAKGAVPKTFSLALGLGVDWTEQWIADFAAGLSQDMQFYDIELSGGDTFRTGGGTVISITAIGEIPEADYVSRAGAKVGDHLFVTGTIGDGALGLLVRMGSLSTADDHQTFLAERYQLPQPRMAVAGLLRSYANAAMDVSDGLVGDLAKLCSASGVGAKLNLAQVPFSKAAMVAIDADSKLLETAVTGGDDYEILFSVSPASLANFERDAKAIDVPITKIGEITSGEALKVFDFAGETVEFSRTSYDHSGAVE